MLRMPTLNVIKYSFGSKVFEMTRFGIDIQDKKTSSAAGKKGKKKKPEPSKSPSSHIPEQVLDPNEEGTIIAEVIEQSEKSRKATKIYFVFDEKEICRLGSTNMTSIPGDILEIRKLKLLDISNNQIPSIPWAISSLENLMFLFATNNKIDKVPESMELLEKLEMVDFSKNRIDCLPDFMIRAQGKWNFKSNEGMKVKTDPKKFDRNIQYDDHDIRVIVIHSLLSPEERRSCCNYRIEEIDFTNYSPKLIAEEKDVQIWKQTCISTSLEIGSAVSYSIYPTDFLPEFCQNNRITVKFDENSSLPVKFRTEYATIMQEQMDDGNSEVHEAMKTLHVLDLIRGVEPSNKPLGIAYEHHAARLLGNEMNFDINERGTWLSIIRSAAKAKAYDFVAHRNFRENIKKLWENKNESDDDNLRQQRTNYKAQPSSMHTIRVSLHLVFISLIIAYAILINQNYEGKIFYFADEIKGRFKLDMVQKPNDFWPFLEKEIIPGISIDPNDYSDISKQDQESVLFGFSRLVGNIRLRQYRSRLETCLNLEPKLMSIDDQDLLNAKCIRPFGRKYRDTSPFGDDDRYRATDSSNLHVGISNAEVHYYEGPAFIVFLPLNETSRNQSINSLKSNYWIDFQTRAVFVEFILANDHSDIIGSFSISIEFLVSGQCIAKISSITIPKVIYNEQFGYIHGISLMILLYSIGISIEVLLSVLARAPDFEFSIVYSLNSFLGLIVFAMHFHLKNLNPENQGSLETEMDTTYIQFQEVSFLWSILTRFVFLMALVSITTILYYLSCNKYFMFILIAVRSMFMHVLYYMIVITAVVFAFSIGAYSIYGSNIKEFSTFLDSVYFFANIFFGDSNFEVLNEADPIFGPMIILLYLLICNVLLLNLLIAILNDAYTELRKQTDTSAWMEMMITYRCLAYELPAPFTLLQAIIEFISWLRKFEFSAVKSLWNFIFQNICQNFTKFFKSTCFKFFCFTKSSYSMIVDTINFSLDYQRKRNTI
eukprot:TRINITY_DN53_c0_g2_i8.p1 TRINITY_DN53_c0_g2~~TRINITY_DN53_c0_g2_i8.p1  ORF type:complete len:995 (-),score=79.93 TRINITY_DN53_c0_g2_i8:337-3321(-)